MRIFAVGLLVLCLGGCYDSRFGEPEAEAVPPSPTVTLEKLRAAFEGVTYPVKSEVIVTGTVTTSDRRRNFYRSLCIEQDGTALEIMAGTDYLHNDYPEGCRVTLRLKGLAVGMSRGILQTGRMPSPGSGFATDYIGSQAALGAVLSLNSKRLTPLTPQTLRIADLTPQTAGRLVRIATLRYSPEELTPGTWTGYKRFTDPSGAEIYTYVRNYADFAGDNVPAGVCTLVGILQWDDAGEGRYILKLRDENDCLR